MFRGLGLEIRVPGTGPVDDQLPWIGHGRQEH